MSRIRKEEDSISDPNQTVRVSEEKIDELMQLTGKKTKADAMREAFEFTLLNWDKLSEFSKISKNSTNGNKLPESISPTEAAKILNEVGIKATPRTVKNWCRKKINICGTKLGKSDKSHWAVSLESVLKFIENVNIESKPTISKWELV